MPGIGLGLFATPSVSYHYGSSQIPLSRRITTWILWDLILSQHAQDCSFHSSILCKLTPPWISLRWVVLKPSLHIEQNQIMKWAVPFRGYRWEVIYLSSLLFKITPHILTPCNGYASFLSSFLHNGQCADVQGIWFMRRDSNMTSPLFCRLLPVVVHSREDTFPADSVNCTN